MSKIATTVIGLQLRKLHNVDPLVGLKVNLPRHCPCGHDMLHVGPGRGPHRASLQCARCGRYCGPVRVRVLQTKPNLHFVDNGEASTVPHIRAEEPPENAGT
jgi:hypothetical protein